MLVSVPLHLKLLPGDVTVEKLHGCLSERYGGSRIVRVMPLGADGFMAANALSGRDDMEIYVTGNDERVQLMARFDNLGKGASGAALQCFNIMTGSGETEGLSLQTDKE
jgi:N-acetyl-gamma-glutamyl-phosphate reductase